MIRFTAYAIFAAALLLLGFPQSSLAVTCDSFTSAAACDGVFTDAGRCKWNAATRTCETSGESLPEGMVGITSIPDNVELTPGPSGSEGSSGTFGSPPPVNGSGLESMAYAPAPEPENLPLSRIFDDGNVQAAAGPGSEDRDFKPPTNSTFCTQPSVQGDCRAYIPSFFYNSESGVCEDFVYGGCGGNFNNFPTLEDCADAAVKYCGADPEKVVTSRAQATISRALSGIFLAMLISLALRQ